MKYGRKPLKTCYNELNNLERERLHAYFIACVKRDLGREGAQEEIDRLWPLVSHIDCIKIINDRGWHNGYLIAKAHGLIEQYLTFNRVFLN